MSSEIFSFYDFLAMSDFSPHQPIPPAVANKHMAVARVGGSRESQNQERTRAERPEHPFLFLRLQNLNVDLNLERPFPDCF